jgi:membrane protease YdiL (CAAX protease family)
LTTPGGEAEPAAVPQGPTLRDCVLVTVVFMVGTVILLVAAVIIVIALRGKVAAGVTTATGARFGLGAGFVIYLWGIAAIWLVVVRRGRLSWRDLGWRPLAPSLWSAVAGVAVASFLGLGLVAMVNGLLVNKGHPVSNVREVTSGLPLDAPTVALAFLSVAVAAPIAEELYFRGLMYQALRRHWGIPAAVVVSAVLFSAAHLLPMLALVLLYMGVVFALVFQWTGSLRATMAMHAFNNALALAVGLAALRHA